MGEHLHRYLRNRLSATLEEQEGKEVVVTGPRVGNQ